jgi:hypothetical protein
MIRFQLFVDVQARCRQTVVNRRQAQGVVRKPRSAGHGGSRVGRLL